MSEASFAEGAAGGKALQQSEDSAVAAGRSELRLWAMLAIASLAVGGLFALLLAVSRIPGMEKTGLWPIGFFSKGLIIHVIFTLMVWFLGAYALLASMATYEVAGGRPRLAGLGQAGLALFGITFPLLFVPAFKSESVASLNNYVPVIIDPTYYLGLVVLAVAVLLPVIRLLANVPGRGKLAPMPLAMTAGAVIYIAALICFAVATRASWGGTPSKAFNETLFWGGGHVLQFLFATMLLTGWFKLLRIALGEEASDTDVFRLAVILVAVFSLGGPFFYAVFEEFSMKQMEALRRLQMVLGFPALLVSVSGLYGVLAARAAGKALPWRSPAFTALTLSVLIFAVGGVMGFVVTGTDTRTPAHYHAVIAAVNLATMGLFLAYVLPKLGTEAPVRPKRLHILLFGYGQLVACLGLFWAGGYGAPRKVASGGAVLPDSAAIGMALHGIGALVAIVGGVLFVIAVARALLRTGSEAKSVPSQ